ncbi:MAG: hypothetical protein ACM3OC_02785 [Deltaproteobacteria bacterium]
MDITEQFKETLSHHQKFVTFSLAVTMQEKCIDIFCRYGVSPETMSFFSVGLERLARELEKGYEFIKIKEDFQSIIGNFDKKDPTDAPGGA